MVLASTLQLHDNKLAFLRASHRNIVDISPPAHQCTNARPVGWHCTWCFPTQDQFVQKMGASSHVAYAKYAQRSRVIRQMMCKGHWLDQGVHGSLQQCHEIPNGSIVLLNRCAKLAMLPVRPPLDNVCTQGVVPCRHEPLIAACRHMRDHVGAQLHMADVQTRVLASSLRPEPLSDSQPWRQLQGLSDFRRRLLPRPRRNLTVSSHCARAPSGRGAARTGGRRPRRPPPGARCFR